MRKVGSTNSRAFKKSGSGVLTMRGSALPLGQTGTGGQVGVGQVQVAGGATVNGGGARVVAGGVEVVAGMVVVVAGGNVVAGGGTEVVAGGVDDTGGGMRVCTQGTNRSSIPNN